MPYAAILADRSVISVTGPESRAFLQGLVSNDMADCGPGRAIYAALLTPQGKILFDFFVADSGAGGFLIDCAAAREADFLKRLALYRLRSKVEIVPRPDLGVAAIWYGNPGMEADMWYVVPSTEKDTALAVGPDPRHAELGPRLIARGGELKRPMPDSLAGDYHAHRLELGVPDSSDLPPDSVFALDAGLEELHGVSFKKGCYVGQEVTSRMKHRATARRRFFIAETEGELPPPGTPLIAGQRELGTLATGKNGRALALARVDRLAEAEELALPISAAGQRFSLRRPPWLEL